MKPIKRTPQFNAHFKARISRNDKLQAVFHDSVESFLVDLASVDDHQLEGKMGLYRAFSINDDYRVVYAETPEYFLFQDIGIHKQVYQR